MLDQTRPAATELLLLSYSAYARCTSFPNLEVFFSNKPDRITYKIKSWRQSFWDVLLFHPLSSFQKAHTWAKRAPAPGELTALTPPLLALHAALTTTEARKPATEEPLLLILAPHFSSLNSLIRARKSSIGYSLFPCNSLLKRRDRHCPSPLLEETLRYHHMNDAWLLPAATEVLQLPLHPGLTFLLQKTLLPNQPPATDMGFFPFFALIKRHLTYKKLVKVQLTAHRQLNDLLLPTTIF